MRTGFASGEDPLDRREDAQLYDINFENLARRLGSDVLFASRIERLEARMRHPSTVKPVMDAAGVSRPESAPE